MRIVTLIAIIFFDQISKYFIQQYFPKNSTYKLNNFLDIVNVHNSGISFGLFDNILSPFVISLIVALVMIFLFYWYFISKSILEKWGLMIILSGGSGNFIDRVTNNYVIDFISVHYKDYYWPAFNVADSAITVGIFILIISTYINYKYRLREDNE